jgi:hypothetical protein
MKKATARKAKKKRPAAKKSNAGKQIIIINRRAAGMEGKKRRKKSARKMSGGGGFEGARKTHRRKRKSSSLMGEMFGISPAKMSGVKNMALDIGAISAGAFAAGYIGNALPMIKDLRVKAAVPIAAGILAAMMGKKPIIKHLGYGLAVAGALSLARQMIPGAPALAGIDETERQLSLVGQGDEVSGATFEVSGATEADEVSGETFEVSGEDMEGGDFEVFGVDEMEGEGEFYTPANT